MYASAWALRVVSELIASKINAGGRAPLDYFYSFYVKKAQELHPGASPHPYDSQFQEQMRVNFARILQLSDSIKRCKWGWSLIKNVYKRSSTSPELAEHDVESCYWNCPKVLYSGILTHNQLEFFSGENT